MQVSQDTSMRATLFQLNENDVWEDKVTGYVTCERSDRHNGMSLFLISERNGAELLHSKIEYDTVYEKVVEEETVIYWCEHASVDLALSFKIKLDCEEIWRKVYQLQRPPFGAIGSAQYVDLKKSRDVDLLQPLSRWIKSYSGVIQPQDTNAIGELMSLRKSALIDSHHSQESRLSILCRYFDQLSAMIAKAPFTLKPQVDFPFRWTTVFDRPETEFIASNARYERASVLFNIAALQSQIARGQLRDRDSDLKVCSKLFQQCAGIFNHLKEHVASMLGQEESTSDLRPELHSAHCALMLAQSQEALYLDALINRKQPAFIAKLAQQTAEAYGEAYKQMSEQRFSKVENMSAKSVRFEAIACYHQSLIHHAAKQYGMQVAYLQRAVELFSGNTASIELFADDFARIKTAYQTAKRDNDFIHHKCVPDTKSLPPIEKAPLARILTFSPPLSEPGTFSDLFAHLIPAALHQAAARFDFRRRESIESEMESLREAHASLLEKMASELTSAILLDSLNLPAALNEVAAADGSSPSSGLLEAVSRLRELLSQVETLKSDRDKLEAELEKQTNNGSDQKSAFFRALTESGGAKEVEITEELLENTFSAIRVQMSEMLEAQQRLIRELELAHAEFVRDGGESLLEQPSKSSHKDRLIRLERLALESQQSRLSHLNDLADEDLQCIFKCLAPYDRLLVSEVCKRWNELCRSRMPWRDISSLDLTHIPCPSIGAVVKHCPNLKSIYASGKLFSRSELCMLAQLPLASFRLYGCDCYLDNVPDDDDQCVRDLLPLVFADSLPVAACRVPTGTLAWEELALNEFGARTDTGWHIVDRRPYSYYYYTVTGGVLPLSLKRLLLAGVCVRTSPGDPRYREPALSVGNLFRNIGRLQNLTCLILVSAMHGRIYGAWFFARDLQKLQVLRELYLGYHDDDEELDFTTVALGLPGLEVLFLNNYSFERPAAENGTIDLVPLITRHPSLRILCIIGLQTGAVEDWDGFEEFRFVRRLYPNGFAAQPVPLLHVFLGKEAAEHMVFGKSSPEALQVHPITEPLPSFLEKEEIAPIFKGVWIAEQIKEDYKNGTKNLYDENEGSAAVSICIMDDTD